jgi:Carbohydrate esterase, sialic acid-specific acetylesterase
MKLNTIKRALGMLAANAACLLAATAAEPSSTPSLSKADGKPADMSKPVQIFILMGQSNMVGMGEVGDDEPGSLKDVIKTKKKFGYLLDDAGAWNTRNDVRFVRVMQGRGLMANEWMTIKGGRIGPEIGIGHLLGNAIDAPVMVLKSCIGNRSLGWDLLPPGSERFVEDGKVYAGYKDKPDSWPVDPAKGIATEPEPWLDKDGKPIDWYAGLQYDVDTANAKAVLAELSKHYPDATKYEIAGFFFWQGEKDAGNPVHAAHYEKNLVRFIKSLRKDFNAPNAKFVLGTMGESVKGASDSRGLILNGQLAVDGASGKYPEFKGNVATIYTHPMAQGGEGNGHYDGNVEVYMDVGEAMGRAMSDLLKNP